MSDEWVELTEDLEDDHPFVTTEPPAVGERGVGHDLPIVKPPAIPAWVKQFGNGKIPLDKMVQVVPGTSSPWKYLIPEAAERWRAFQAAAAGAGFTLTNNGGYRSYEQQVSEFERRYQLTPTSFGTRAWQGKTYYLKSGDMFHLASPGTSNHGYGAAIDMGLDADAPNARPVDQAFLDWAKNTAVSFGFSWENYEKHHIRLVAPAAATSMGGGVGMEGKAAPAGVPQPTLAVGSTGDQVVALQNLCLANAWGDVGRADGRFGPRTEGGVKAMQAAIGAMPDGRYGPKSAAALGAFLQRAR
jgi:peptidoglycan hydrolase-like protein with peptidoglycan-binding domain